MDSDDVSLDRRTDPGRLVVWERDGSWARHLRRLLAGGGLRVHEARTLEAFRKMIVESPASLLLVELVPAAAVELRKLTVRFRREFPAVRIVAVGDPRLEAVRWPLLETGIVWLCTSPRALAPVAGIIRVHFAQVPKPERSPEQRIWDDLPWAACRAAERGA
ncbi:MAG: hypothetical protein ACYC6Y_21190 [Thermoguttaceae bacterium]